MPYIPEEARQRLGNGHSRIHGAIFLNLRAKEISG